MPQARLILATTLAVAAVTGCSEQEQPSEVTKACAAVRDAQAYLSQWPGTDPTASGGPSRAAVFRWKQSGRVVMSILSKYLPVDRLENGGADADFARHVAAFVMAANDEWTKPLDLRVIVPAPGAAVERTCI